MVATGWLRVDSPASSSRFQEWASAYASSHVASSVWLPEGCTTFSGRMRRRQLGDALLVDVEADPFGLRYDQRSDVTRYVGFSVNKRAFAERVVYDGSVEHIQQSRIDLWDATHLVESEVLTPMAQTLVLVPKAALCLQGGLPVGLSAAVRRGEGASLRLLRDLLLTVAEQVDRLSPASAAAARNAIVELMLVVARDRLPGANAAVNEAMRLSVCRWVDDHLRQGTVSPAEVADYHGISVRSLQRLFVGTGETFGSMVRRRRLDRARRDVLGTDDMIQTIAARWGYADAGHLSHEFKRVSGMTPVEYRQAGRSDSTAEWCVDGSVDQPLPPTCVVTGSG